MRVFRVIDGFSRGSVNRRTRGPGRSTVRTVVQRPITADTALRLGLFFGMEPRFWLNLQSEYDIRIADRELRAKLSARIRVFQPVAA